MANHRTTLEAWHDRGDRYLVGKMLVDGEKVRNVQRLFDIKNLNVTRGVRQYWKRKVMQPGWHAGSHGGARNVKFSFDIKAMMRSSSLLPFLLQLAFWLLSAPAAPLSHFTMSLFFAMLCDWGVLPVLAPRCVRAQ